MAKNVNVAKNKKQALKNMFGFCKKYRFVIILSLIFASVSAVFTIIGPNKIGDITDYIYNGIFTTIDMNGILSVTKFLITIYLIGAVCSLAQQLILADITQRISKKLRADINDKINKLPLKYFTDHSYGDVLSRVTNDVDTISQSLSNTLGSLVSAIVSFIGCIIMMFVTNGILAITAILTTSLGLVLMFVIAKYSQKYFVERQIALGKINGYIEEMYTGHSVIRTNHAENKVNQEFTQFNKKVKKANFKSQFLGGLMPPVMTFVGNLGYVAVCIVGASLIINGNVGLGVITSFILYVRLFENPIRQFSQIMSNLQSAMASSERVSEFLTEQEMDNEEEKLQPKFVGNVEFKHVKFAYPSSPDKEIIHDLNLQVKAGEKVAIVGPTGAGKTTIVNLLMRFFEITSGEIYIDGMNTKELTRQQVHNAFSMVLQDSWLFEGTIRDNLVFNLTNVTDEQINRVCESCGLTHFIHTLPNGLDTVISNNSNISAGQKQLLTIARAMLQNSPMLILDEATSSIDTLTEIQVQQAMDKLMKDRTSFVIAHRLSTIKNADIILVLKNGDVVEQGNHEELLAKNGFYAELYNSQFDEM